MALNGALYVMISHGLISPLLFFLVGSVFYDRAHTRMMDEMGGYFSKVPVAATILAFASFANLGLPGLSGFVGEFFTFVGSFPCLPDAGDHRRFGLGHHRCLSPLDDAAGADGRREDGWGASPTSTGGSWPSACR